MPPKVLVISPASQSGKSTVARVIAEELGTKATGTSEIIKRDLAHANGFPWRDGEGWERARVLIKHAWGHSFEPRRALYKHGRHVCRKANDPAYLVRKALELGSVVDGCREPDELAAARALVTHVVWVLRPGQKPDESDHLVFARDSLAGDEVIANYGTLKDLTAEAEALAVYHLKETPE